MKQYVPGVATRMMNERDAALAEAGRLLEALEIAYDALLRTTRDEAFGYEEKKAVEEYVHRVLKESGRGESS